MNQLKIDTSIINLINYFNIQPVLLVFLIAFSLFCPTILVLYGYWPAEQQIYLTLILVLISIPIPRLLQRTQLNVETSQSIPRGSYLETESFREKFNVTWIVRDYFESGSVFPKRTYVYGPICPSCKAMNTLETKQRDLFGIFPITNKWVCITCTAEYDRPDCRNDAQLKKLI